MPSYDYICESNGQVVTVRHSMDVELATWGEVCYAAQHPMGETDFEAPVRKMISAPAVVLPVGNSQLKNAGFTKLVKRDHGVYENVTATGGESRYMKAGDNGSLPELARKIRD